MPSPQQELLACDHELLNLLKFCRTKPAAARQPDRVEPELRSVRIPFHVDMGRLVPIRGIEEEPICTLTMNGRHMASLTPSTAHSLDQS